VQVVVNVPLSDKTRHMFNDETIGKMKKGAILVRIIHPAVDNTSCKHILTLGLDPSGYHY
jgi:D-isomer specific 2-hydroxyacid dehydrogenase, NAD binding domain